MRSLGCERVLTSGARASAIEGVDVIAALVRQAAGRIGIMPGAGLSEHNLCMVRQRTGAHEFHASARGMIAAQVSSPHPYIRDLGGDYQRTDIVRVRRMVDALQQE